MSTNTKSGGQIPPAPDAQTDLLSGLMAKMEALEAKNASLEAKLNAQSQPQQVVVANVPTNTSQTVMAETLARNANMENAYSERNLQGGLQPLMEQKLNEAISYREHYGEWNGELVPTVAITMVPTDFGDTHLVAYPISCSFPLAGNQIVYTFRKAGDTVNVYGCHAKLVDAWMRKLVNPNKGTTVLDKDDNDITNRTTGETTR